MIWFLLGTFVGWYIGTWMAEAEWNQPERQSDGPGVSQGKGENLDG